MKGLHFFKFQGTGNDFILVDNREGHWAFGKEDIERLCHRRFGIGSDGLILLEIDQELDFKMNFYNPDGSQSFCGNGSRCAVKFAQMLGIVHEHCTFRAVDGVHEAEIEGDVVRIHMRDVQGWQEDDGAIVLHTGSPHWVKQVSDVGAVNLVKLGREIRYSDRYSPHGINVNIAELHDDWIRMRTYERGVEDETLSCGTGVTAAALVAGILFPEKKNINVLAPGGKLTVHWRRKGNDFTDIWLVGPAEMVFEGDFAL